MGVHKHWHAFPAHFFTPAEFHGTGSTGEDESPCGTIESVKMANGGSDLVDLITVYRRRKNGGVTHVRWVPGPCRGVRACTLPIPSVSVAPVISDCCGQVACCIFLPHSCPLPQPAPSPLWRTRGVNRTT